MNRYELNQKQLDRIEELEKQNKILIRGYNMLKIRSCRDGYTHKEYSDILESVGINEDVL